MHFYVLFFPPELRRALCWCLDCSSCSESYPCVPSLSASFQALEQQCPEMEPMWHAFNGPEFVVLPSSAWLLLAYVLSLASIMEAHAISDVALQPGISAGCVALTGFLAVP